MRDSARFWDKLADKYSKKPVKDMGNYNKTLDCTRKRSRCLRDVASARAPLYTRSARHAGRRS